MKKGRLLSIGLVSVIAIAIAAITVRLYQVPSARTLTYDVGEISAIPVLTDERSLQRGKHVSKAIAVCQLCHGFDLGGKLAFEHPILGKGYTPNLTRGEGGIGASYTSADWVKAIRHGVNRDGRGLMFMPSDHYAYLTDQDLGAMIGYFQSLPPVDNRQNQLALTPMAKLMIDLGISGEVVRAKSLDHTTNLSVAFNGKEQSPAYTVEIGGCTFCHGRDLRGGQGLEPGAPPGPDITGIGLSDWNFAQFATVMRTGIRPDESIIDYRFMPWQAYQNMTEEELKSIWDYLNNLSQPS